MANAAIRPWLRMSDGHAAIHPGKQLEILGKTFDSQNSYIYYS
jgi:hypothetical protein